MMTTREKLEKKGNGQFFFKMSHALTAKNKMDEEIHDFLYSIDGTLIQSPKDLEHFKEFLQDRVKEIHSRHPRCKELRMNIWGMYSDRELAVSCGCSTGKIYQVNQNYTQP